MEKLKITPLGGIGEIGKNFTVFEGEQSIIIVDCGMGFPDDSMLGIDVVIPDTTYLDDKADKIKAVLLTHAHEDHIGAVPYFLKKFPNVPIVGTKLTMAVLQSKLNEFNLKPKTKIVKSGEIYKVGEFNVEIIKVNHSIAGAVAFAITTTLGTIIMTGDFKIDMTPTHGSVIDLNKFAAYGNNGVRLLMCDSTNAEKHGSTKSESEVAAELINIFHSNRNRRITVATFSSNMYRIQSIIKAALKNGRKIAFTGKSMLRIVDASIKLGYIEIEDEDIIELDEVSKYNDSEVAIITTGSQGEPMSALHRMAYSEHRQISLGDNDVVVLSSHTIPGNEALVNDIVNKLIEKGVKLIFDSELNNVHASGHACRDELKIMHAIIKPEYFMPVHGEIRHLYAHKQLAMSMGMPEKKIIMPKLGKTIVMTKKSITYGNDVESGEVYVDGSGIGDVGNIVIKDRQIMAGDGIIIAVIKINPKTFSIVGSPDIVSRGFVYVREADELMKKIRGIAYKEASICESQHITSWKDVKQKVRDAISKYVYHETKRSPMIIPIIVSVP